MVATFSKTLTGAIFRRPRWAHICIPCAQWRRLGHNSVLVTQASTRRPSTVNGQHTRTVSRHQSRPFFEGMVVFLHSHITPVLFPPALFVALVITLWTQKCIMMILFQNKIIYMPSLPPFSRQEKLEDYQKNCGPVSWEKSHIKSLDGTRLAVCTGSVAARGEYVDKHSKESLVLLYFQGNGSSTPPRLPMLSQVLLAVSQDSEIGVVLVALSYRGYWTSSGRASQRGIERDSQAFLQWIKRSHPSAHLVLWGQSIGAGIATQAAARYMEDNASSRQIAGLVLETPFVSIRRMLAALYPERWVPYKYLWPFLRNWWDTEQALRQLAKNDSAPSILLLSAQKDEVVPTAEVDYLETLCKELRVCYTRRDTPGALHNEASTKIKGRESIAAFVRTIGKSCPISDRDAPVDKASSIRPK